MTNENRNRPPVIEKLIIKPGPIYDAFLKGVRLAAEQAGGDPDIIELRTLSAALDNGTLDKLRKADLPKK